MNSMVLVIIGIVVIAVLALPLVWNRRKVGSSETAVRSIKLNLVLFGLMAALFLLFPIASFATSPAKVADSTVSSTEVQNTMAEEVAVEETTSSSSGLQYIAAALATGIACLGAGIAVGGAAPAAIGAVTEDPKSFGKSLIFVVLGEGVAIYGLLISILILQ